METAPDFEDMLKLLSEHPADRNQRRANRALSEFGSPLLLEKGDVDQILQIGVAPNRIDILSRIEGVRFETAWRKRIQGRYGNVLVNWIDIDSLIRAKRLLDGPRHQEDVRVLREVKKLRKRRT